MTYEQQQAMANRICLRYDANPEEIVTRIDQIEQQFWQLGIFNATEEQIEGHLLDWLEQSDYAEL